MLMETMDPNRWYDRTAIEIIRNGGRSGCSVAKLFRTTTGESACPARHIRIEW